MNQRITCKFCNGFYDFGSEQPVCSTCHAFVYEFSTDSLTDCTSTDEKEASNDSGNEEPEKASDLFPLTVSQENLFPYSSCPQASSCTFNSSHNRGHCGKGHRLPPKWCTLHNPSGAITPPIHRIPGDAASSDNQALLSSVSFESLPTEVLLRIFNYVDDMGLWSLRLSSERCRIVIDNEVPDERWATFVEHRWPLFAPHHRISSWRLLYLNMMDSVTCRFCLGRLRSPVLFPIEGPGLRFRRIVSEIKSLCSDPPYGINALALDTETYSHCLAGIAGPPSSPYEGGHFYVHILIPDSHPMRPPVIRFLTRILHPNISFHGDIGLDCIRHNWSLALTLDKLLISVQSLLTDPYTTVCMEPSIGALYNDDRDKFEELAKLWTWKFACHDYLSTNFVYQLNLPDYMDYIVEQNSSPNFMSTLSSPSDEKKDEILHFAFDV